MMRLALREWALMRRHLPAARVAHLYKPVMILQWDFS